jgi:hypothetical protein
MYSLVWLVHGLDLHSYDSFMAFTCTRMTRCRDGSWTVAGYRFLIMHELVSTVRFGAVSVIGFELKAITRTRLTGTNLSLWLRFPKSRQTFSGFHWNGYVNIHPIPWLTDLEMWNILTSPYVLLLGRHGVQARGFTFFSTNAPDSFSSNTLSLSTLKAATLKAGCG